MMQENDVDGWMDGWLSWQKTAMGYDVVRTAA